MSNPSDTRETSVRLQKVIAASGLSSRRAAEALIREGKVTVNGQVVRLLGTCINPTTDHVKVDGTHIETVEPEVFVLLNKPPGCVTTMNDPLGRGTVADLLRRVKVRVFPVGRLDFDAEGLLLLTNNGMVAQACLHPRYHVPKTYVVKVSGVFSDEEINMLKEGVRLEDGVTSPADVRKSGKARANSWLEITIREGKKHQIKRMVEACGHRVIRLKRIRFGPLQLGDLPVGTFRYATDAEANTLREILQGSTNGETARAPRRKPYLKNRIKPGDTPASKTRRKPLNPILARERAKPRGASATRPSGAPVVTRSGLFKKPLSPIPASRNVPSTKGTKKSSGSFRGPSNFRGASVKSSTASGNVSRGAFSKKPSSSRGTSGNAQPFRGKEGRPAFPQKPAKQGSYSATRQSSKGTSSRYPFSKKGSGPIRKTSAKRRSQKG